MAPPRCEYCGKAFITQQAVNHHILASRSCSRDFWRNDFIKNNNSSPLPKQLKKGSLTDTEGELEGNLDIFDSVADDFVMPSRPRRASVEEDEGEDGSENTYPTYNQLLHWIVPWQNRWRTQENKNTIRSLVKKPKRGGKNSMVPVCLGINQVVAENVGQSSTDEFLKLAIVRQVYNF